MKDYGPGSHSSKRQALDYKMQWWGKTGWGKGCSEMVTLKKKKKKKKSAATAQLTPLSIGYTSSLLPQDTKALPS